MIENDPIIERLNRPEPPRFRRFLVALAIVVWIAVAVMGFLYIYMMQGRVDKLEGQLAGFNQEINCTVKQGPADNAPCVALPDVLHVLLNANNANDSQLRDLQTRLQKLEQPPPK